jgi:hypothetical protein
MIDFRVRVLHMTLFSDAVELHLDVYTYLDICLFSCMVEGLMSVECNRR